jgi:competence protein ComFA
LLACNIIIQEAFLDLLIVALHSAKGGSLLRTTGSIYPQYSLLGSQSIKHEAVYAADKARHEKVARFRNEEYSLLLTTTILERGITISNLDVAVLGAEDHVFTESALVQIAGRVGRSAKMPTGDVTFFHYGKTDAMVRARAQINWMNKREV